MKGNASCHIPNSKYRDNYDSIFRKELDKVYHQGCGGVAFWVSRIPSSDDSLIPLTEDGKVKEYTTLIRCETCHTNMYANEIVYVVEGDDKKQKQ